MAIASSFLVPWLRRREAEDGRQCPSPQSLFEQEHFRETAGDDRALRPLAGGQSAARLGTPTHSVGAGDDHHLKTVASSPYRSARGKHVAIIRSLAEGDRGRDAFLLRRMYASRLASASVQRHGGYVLARRGRSRCDEQCSPPKARSFPMDCYRGRPRRACWCRGELALPATWDPWSDPLAAADCAVGSIEVRPAPSTPFPTFPWMMARPGSRPCVLAADKQISRGSTCTSAG